MSKTQIYLDCPGEERIPRFPCFFEDGKLYMGLPASGIVVFVDAASKGTLEAIVNGQAVAKEALEPGRHNIPLTKFVPQAAGEAYFTFTADGAETVKSLVYAFVHDYSGAYASFERRRRENHDRLARLQRLALDCPPPQEGETYDVLIARQYELAKTSTGGAQEQLQKAAALAAQLSTMTARCETDTAAMTELSRLGAEASNRANQLLAAVKTSLEYADYYRSQRDQKN
jgi:hypothetical protein